VLLFFFFEHNNTNQKEGTQFLAFVEVMEEHSVADYDPCIPVVKRCKSREEERQENPTRTVRRPTYAVINTKAIIGQIGLIQNLTGSLEDKVIAPYYVFNENIRLTAGDIRNL
jgi:uncharacterized protein YacL